MQKKRLLQVVGVASGALLLSTVLKKRAAGAPSGRKWEATDVGDSSNLVWVNTERGVYHQPDTRWYGKTASGEYMSENAARAGGFKAAARTVPSSRKRTAKK